MKSTLLFVFQVVVLRMYGTIWNRFWVHNECFWYGNLHTLFPAEYRREKMLCVLLCCFCILIITWPCKHDWHVVLLSCLKKFFISSVIFLLNINKITMACPLFFSVTSSWPFSLFGYGFAFLKDAYFIVPIPLTCRPAGFLSLFLWSFVVR